MIARKEREGRVPRTAHALGREAGRRELGDELGSPDSSSSEREAAARRPPRRTAYRGGVGYRDANPAQKNQPRLARDLGRQERAGTEETHGSAVVFEATVRTVVACGGQEQQTPRTLRFRFSRHCNGYFYIRLNENLSTGLPVAPMSRQRTPVASMSDRQRRGLHHVVVVRGRGAERRKMREPRRWTARPP